MCFRALRKFSKSKISRVSHYNRWIIQCNLPHSIWGYTTLIVDPAIISGLLDFTLVQMTMLEVLETILEHCERSHDQSCDCTRDKRTTVDQVHINFVSFPPYLHIFACLHKLVSPHWKQRWSRVLYTLLELKQL